MADQRRFPPPWRAEPIPGGYIVRDANGRGGCAGKTARAYRWISDTRTV
jgi:hypothetical protein